MRNMSLRLITTYLAFIVLLSSAHAFPSDFFPRVFPNGSSVPPTNLTAPWQFPNGSSIPPTNLTAAWQSFHNLSGCRPGENRDGLAKLKQYFQQFGYLDNQNFTDEFDNSFESALKTYQQNFNLNSTGELDQTTVDQILRPRCGVADIVNGTSTMNSGKTPSSPFQTVAHFSYFPGSPRWPAGTDELTYAFAPENQLDDSVKAVFGTAFNRWSQVTTLTFRETEVYSSADIKIGFYTGDHGDGEPFDGVLGTLAHAFSPPSGRLHLDGAENWVINSASLKSVSSAVDLESVVVHEIGHLLGLGHSSVEEAVMFPSIPSGTVKVELDVDDVEGIQNLYGSNPNYVAASDEGSQQRETNAGNIVGPVWERMLVIAVGLALFVL